jgi:radical SAM/Cys-rich protein
VTFKDKLSEINMVPLRALGVDVLQVNLGYRCLMACRHCHVQAGPDRTELMDRENVEWVLEALRKSPGMVLDLTGGSPELNPHFKHLVREARKLGRHVTCRSNLTILTEDIGRDLPEFYRDQAVEVIASLPCYTEETVDTVRGRGVFQKSLSALRRLNALGFGGDSPNLRLHLVYNPEGPFLPAGQAALEAAYRKELKERYDVTFNRLFAFSNMPLGRFRDHLVRMGHLEKYMNKLEKAFRPEAAQGVMCRQMINVGWDGSLYDCDFNQALGLRLHEGCPRHIRSFDPYALTKREIRIGDHCFGCTAGEGFT